MTDQEREAWMDGETRRRAGEFLERMKDQGLVRIGRRGAALLAGLILDELAEVTQGEARWFLRGMGRGNRERLLRRLESQTPFGEGDDDE